jgi:hypothetical protein
VTKTLAVPHSIETASTYPSCPSYPVFPHAYKSLPLPCRSSLLAAWLLSSFSYNKVLLIIAPWLLLFTLLCSWTFLYLFIQPIRNLADDTASKIYYSLPPALQEQGSRVWHLFLPEWLLHSVAPAFLQVAAAIAIPLFAIGLLTSAPLLSWWVRRVSAPAAGHGATVYGVTVKSAEVLTDEELKALQLQSTERPDLSAGVPGTVSDDTQERFWKDSDFNAAAAKQSLKADAEWRKKFKVDSIMSVCLNSPSPRGSTPHYWNICRCVHMWTPLVSVSHYSVLLLCSTAAALNIELLNYNAIFTACFRYL